MSTPPPFPTTGRLVGRDRELAALHAALARALAGQGGLILIGGEAGIGKTALAEWLGAAAVAQGARVLVGRCYDLSETPPYGPWQELFAHAPAAGLPDLPAAVRPPDQESDQPASGGLIVARVQAYLAALATQQPLVLVLDDLHWADPASLDLLRVLARDLTASPLLVLATYRADELDRQHPLARLLPVLVREARAERLDLRPLDAVGLRAFVRDRYALPPAAETRLVAYLATHAEGNPFFAGELLRALAEARTLCPDGAAGWALGDLAGAGVPPLLRQVIDARVDRLGADTREALAVAAVLGQEASLPLWAAVAGCDEAALAAPVEQAAAAHLLHDAREGPAVRFVHALVREALYAGIPLPRRRTWHQRAAAALLALPDPDPDAVAYHLQQAGDTRAGDWLLRAGGRALRVYAWLTAADRFAAALPWLEQVGAPASERAWLLYALARLRVFAQPQRSAAALADAARLAADDDLLLGYIEQLRGLTECMGGDFVRGLASMAAGIANLEGAPAHEIPDRLRMAWNDPPPLSQLRGQHANWLAYTGRCAEVADLLARVAADPGPLSPSYHSAEGYIHLAQGRPLAARHALARSRAANRAREDYFQVGFNAFSELNWVVMRYYADDLTMRQAVSVECEEAMIRASDVLMPGLAPRLAQFPTAFIEGRWDEARALAQQARAENPPLTHHCNPLAGAVAVAQGNRAEALAAIVQELPDGPATAPGRNFYLTALSLCHLAAILALDAGDLPAAHEWLTAYDRWLAWTGAVLGQAEGQLGWAAYHRVTGNLALAREHAEAALAQATEPRQPLALLAAHRLLGELATAAGQYADAQPHLDAALALADACAAPYERALILLALAELRAAEGQPDTARVLLDEVRAICTPLSARPALARADKLAVRLALLRAPRPRYPAGLTAREVEILRLLAAGQSNREIASALSLSPHTVERHLANLYGKIAARGRADATAFAFRHHLT
ncbi:MAG: helix-turn-helix transcriptional regulator [Thermomicrobiales bacterium]